MNKARLAAILDVVQEYDKFALIEAELNPMSHSTILTAKPKLSQGEMPY